MKLHVPTLTLIAAIALGSPLTGMAAKKKADASASPSPAATATPAATTAPEEKEAKADRGYRYKGTILEVDGAAKTFSIKGKKETRVFKVTDKTKLTKEADAPATWDDIKAGEQVRVSGKKTGEGTYEATSVKLGAKEPAESKTK